MRRGRFNYRIQCDVTAILKQCCFLLWQVEQNLRDLYPMPLQLLRMTGIACILGSKGVVVANQTRRLSSYGFTYSKLLDEVRFEMARELLFDAKMRIEDVAGTVGFSDPSHFARMFRRISGLSPTEFRKMTRS